MPKTRTGEVSRRFLAALLCLPACLLGGAAAADERPNIVLIFADDKYHSVSEFLPIA